MRSLRPAAVLAVVTTLMVPSGGAGVPETVPGPIAARLLGVVDGDTIIVRARIWLGQDVETRLRLDGVDAPELKGRCERERRAAAAARDFIRSLGSGGRVVLRDIQYGKYAGRVVARVETPAGADFAEALLRAGLGRPYDGGRRPSWCDGRMPD